ncbi:hypothetical protein N185_08570 [Sinorhizobium sp. GW3]|nr:hypothetical protein N185_08570 [Sinorhizobium sp. GW3]
MSEKIVNDERLLVARAESRPIVGRGQRMAEALSSYARALTFENRSRRNLYRLAGLAPRARDRAFSLILAAIVVLTLLLPIAAGIFYYSFIASPGFTSEVRFIVRSSAPILSRDRYSGTTVEPKAKIVQDTAVLLNYLASPAIIQSLEKEFDLQKVYSRADIDVLSRLKSHPTQDEVLKYWKKRYSASVNSKSGIVELRVTAFTQREARDLVKLVLNLSERRINELSSGMWNDLLKAAESDVHAASKEVAQLRGKLRDTQNETGVFDVDLSAESITSILTGIEGDIAELKSRRAALSQTIDKSAPQLTDMDRRIAALEEQAQNLAAKTAGTSDSGGRNLANYSSVFDQLKLDLKIAEDKLRSSITEVEKVKLVSSLQLVYVDNFTDPTWPDESTYPNVPIALLLLGLACTATCGAVCGVVLIVRNKLD